MSAIAESVNFFSHSSSCSSSDYSLTIFICYLQYSHSTNVKFCVGGCNSGDFSSELPQKKAPTETSKLCNAVISPFLSFSASFSAASL